MKRILLIFITGLLFAYSIYHLSQDKNVQKVFSETEKTISKMAVTSEVRPNRTKAAEPIAPRNPVDAKLPVPIARALALSDKALLTHSERSNLENELSDPNNIRQALEIVGGTETEPKRMRAISYIAEAAQWTGNPARTLVLSEIGAFLRNAKINQNLSLSEKRSHGADHIELFAILYQQDSVQGEKLISEMTDTVNGRLMVFARNFYEQKQRGTK